MLHDFGPRRQGESGQVCGLAAAMFFFSHNLLIRRQLLAKNDTQV